jgi:hypothetical protein
MAAAVRTRAGAAAVPSAGQVCTYVRVHASAAVCVPVFFKSIYHIDRYGNMGFRLLKSI